MLIKLKGCVLHFCHKKMSYVFSPHNKRREIRAQILLKKKNQIIQVTNGDDMYICHGDLEKQRISTNVQLTKLAWMVTSKRDSLDMQIFRAKYKVGQNWLYKNPCKSTSPPHTPHPQRAIEKTKVIILKRTCYLIGDEVSINVWKDF